MPRPEIQGLKYFPFDVGFFRDKKIRLLRGEQHAEGVEVYQRLLCKIYEDNGYYSPWNDSEDYALLAEDTGYSEEKIRLIVSTCLNRSLFDNTLFKLGNVLTSRSIQRRYFSAIRDTKIKAAAQGRYTYIEKDLCLLSDSDFSEINKTCVWLKVGPNHSFSENNPSKSENKPNKSPINPANEMKGNKSKLNDTADKGFAPTDSFEETGQQQQQLIIKHFINNIQVSPSPLIIEKLCGWLDTFPADVIIKALDETVLAGGSKRNYRYIESILKAWEEEKLFTLSLVEGHLKEWADKKKNKGSVRQTQPKNRFANFKQREWDFDAIEKAEMARLQEKSAKGANKP